MFNSLFQNPMRLLFGAVIILVILSQSLAIVPEDKQMLEDLVAAYEEQRPTLGNVQICHHLTEVCLAIGESHRRTADQIRHAPIELQTYRKCVANALASAIRSFDHQAFANYVADRKMKSSRAG